VKWTLIADATVPALGVQIGDVIAYDPSALEPCLLIRSLPASRRTLTLAIACGSFRVVEPSSVDPSLTLIR
jgi:hypothetical protein